jgi:hypothetical protein
MVTVHDTFFVVQELSVLATQCICVFHVVSVEKRKIGEQGKALAVC